MNIVEFFQHRAGTWNSQRTNHDLSAKKSESGKSEITVEILTFDRPQVIDLCQSCGFRNEQAICAVRVNWRGLIVTSDTSTEDYQGESILVAIAGDNLQEGKILLRPDKIEKNAMVGRYKIDSDDVLSLVIEHDSWYSEEKFWFPRPNICLRAGLTVGKSNVSSFWTEIRKLPPKT